MVSPRVSTGTRDLYILISDINSRIECTLSKCAGGAKLRGVVDMSRGWDDIQKDVERL